jgi:hypothetical protein
MTRLVGRKSLIALTLLFALAALAWFGRTPLLAWYYLERLACAAGADRPAWAERVASLEGAVVPDLVGWLARDDVAACAGAEAALSRVLQRWGAADARSVQLVDDLAARFDRLSLPGRHAVLELLIVLLRPCENQPAPPDQMTRAAAQILTAAAADTDPGTRARALALAEVLVDRPFGPDVTVYRRLVQAGLTDADEDCRVRAVRLTLQAVLKDEGDLPRQVVPLLRDASPKVRRAALLAVGLAEQTITEDDLLPLLHDEDKEVRRLCESALRGRGLKEGHLKLARLISHPDPMSRLEVLRLLPQADDLDPGVWLRRLSQDPDAAVRVAAMRAASEHPQVDLSARLREMRDGDPSETVRQLAAHYLQRPRRR